MTDSPYVVAYRTALMAEGQMVLELLQGEGIAARLVRPQGVIAGVASNLYETKIEVPATSAERAAALLSELEFVGSSEEADRTAQATAPEPAEPRHSRRRPLIAAGLGLLFPGASHLYVRRPWTTLVLALAFLAACVTRALVGHDSALGQGTILAILALIATDIAGGLRALASSNDGSRVSRMRQLGRGLVLVSIAIAAATAATAVVDAPRRARSREAAQWSATCTARTITLHNGTDHRRTARLKIINLFPWAARQPYDPLSLRFAQDVFVLEPSARQSTVLDVSDSLILACGGMPAAAQPSNSAPVDLDRLFRRELSGEPRATDCGFWFDLALDADAEHSLDALHLKGTCHPAWTGDGATAPTAIPVAADHFLLR